MSTTTLSRKHFIDDSAVSLVISQVETPEPRLNIYIDDVSMFVETLNTNNMDALNEILANFSEEVAEGALATLPKWHRIQTGGFKLIKSFDVLEGTLNVGLYADSEGDTSLTLAVVDAKSNKVLCAETLHLKDDVSINKAFGEFTQVVAEQTALMVLANSDM